MLDPSLRPQAQVTRLMVDLRPRLRGETIPLARYVLVVQRPACRLHDLAQLLLCRYREKLRNSWKGFRNGFSPIA